MVAPRPYEGRSAVLATKHDKLSLISPEFEGQLGLAVTAVEIDTDVFGTFSGEVSRELSQFECAVAKARQGMQFSGSSIGIASEGSIGMAGPWPVVSDFEIVVFVDDKEGFVLAESAESVEIITHSWIINGTELNPVDLERVGFPTHGVIVRPADGFEPIQKGIHDYEELMHAIERCALNGVNRIRIESDLRANHCPSRRPTISAAAHRLANRLSSNCPACSCPGWGVIEVVRGRRCSICGLRTNSRIGEKYGCARCAFTEVTNLIGEPADPSNCVRCNP